jgi:hypothetical protein
MTAETAPTETPVTSVVSVVGFRSIPSGSGFGVPHAPAVYTPHRTKKGVWVWRLTERCLLGEVRGRNGLLRERGVYTTAKASRLAGEIAAARGLPEWGAAHNRPMTPNEVRMFVGA